MNKHTPLEWRTADNSIHAGEGAESVMIATLYETEYHRDGQPIAGVPSHEEMEANTRFIVSACNAHDDLLAALKQVTEQLHIYLEGDPSNEEDMTDAESAYQFAAATIAKAEVQP
jgi:hypothetical protein